MPRCPPTETPRAHGLKTDQDVSEDSKSLFICSAEGTTASKPNFICSYLSVTIYRYHQMIPSPPVWSIYDSRLEFMRQNELFAGSPT